MQRVPAMARARSRGLRRQFPWTTHRCFIQRWVGRRSRRTRDRDRWACLILRIDEEIFEWRHLFSAILEARNTFTMIEGGLRLWPLADSGSMRSQTMSATNWRFRSWGSRPRKSTFNGCTSISATTASNPEGPSFDIQGAVEDNDGEDSLCDGSFGRMVRSIRCQLACG